MFAGNVIIAISSLGALQVIFDHWFWKGDPDFIIMFNWNFLSILHGLDVIRRFVFGWVFLTGGEILGFFGQNDPKR